MSPVLLVARREIRARLHQRGYLIGVAVTLLIIVAASIAPKLIKGSSTDYDLAVVGTNATQLTASLQSEANARGLKITVHPATAAQADSKVKAGKWDAAIIDDRQIVAQSDTSTATALLQAAHQALAIATALHEAGLSDQQIQRAYDVPTLSVQTITNEHQAQRRALATIIVVALFAQLVTFCTWVAVGVVEEKSSRVVEVLLSAIKPLQLLTGKLLGIGSLAVGQTVLMGAVALIATRAADTLKIPGGGWDVIAIAVVAFVLGFGFFAALASALASTVSRQEEVSGVLAPMTVILMVCYFASFTVTGSPDSTLARVLSMVPPVSCIAMPARIAGGHVPLLDIAIAFVAAVVAVLLVLMLAARIYRSSILHTGDKLSLRRAWRSEAVGSES